MLIEMIATQDFQQDGRDVSAGDRLSVRPIVAAALKYQRLARFATVQDAQPAQRAVITPVSTPAERNAVDKPKRRRRRSKRRDVAPTITK